MRVSIRGRASMASQHWFWRHLIILQVPQEGPLLYLDVSLPFLLGKDRNKFSSEEECKLSQPGIREKIEK